MSTAVEDRLRRAFASRAQTTVVSGPCEFGATSDVVERGGVGGDTSMMTLDVETVHRRTPSRIALVSVAAALAMITVAVVATRRSATDAGSPATSANAAVAVTDPNALTLDSLVDPSNTGADPTDDVFVVLDMDHLPDGWTVDNWTAYTMLMPSTGYQYSATVNTPEGDVVYVSVAPSSVMGEPPSEAPLPDDPGSATIVGNSIKWEPSPGIHVAITAATSTAEADLTQAAQSLGFVTTDVLPTPTLDAGTTAPDPHAQLSGSLDGIPWSADVADGPLRTMNVTVGGDGGGGFANDRLSQPHDGPVGFTETTISGVPGHGAIAFGYGPATAATMRATTAGGATVDLPLYRRELESYFAVPIPEGVAVTTLTLLADDGTDVATINLPMLPVGLGGTYGVAA